MNHKAHVQLETHTVEDTQQFGQLLGRWVKQSGEPLCIALIGDLGTGKTHLSQGIAKGFGVTEEITSPTFAIMNTYDVDRTHLYHFDVYRLDDIASLKILASTNIQRIAYPLWNGLINSQMNYQMKHYGFI